MNDETVVTGAVQDAVPGRRPSERAGSGSCLGPGLNAPVRAALPDLINRVAAAVQLAHRRRPGPCGSSGGLSCPWPPPRWRWTGAVRHASHADSL
ncbi:hypothetical protein KAURM247S_00819 [Kitasatospora aureofaciens]